MADTLAASLPNPRRLGADAFFAGGIVAMLTILFLPIPPILIDLGLAFSIALSALILMVALWIQRPLDFSAFPTVLLIATILRLALNVATTRLILSRGGEGEQAAGHVVAGFSKFVMGGDFVIGLIIFAILVTVNFVVITKGATRIAEVGARFTLDAIPGKQMAIDADLSAGLIDDKEAQRRRRELEEESAFFGAMDGASKFVRGDAIAGLIITAINIFGGIIIGVTHHGLTLSRAADVYTKLSVGDGLVSQMPALIVSLSAGLLVSKGGTRGSAEQAVLRQLSGYPRAVSAAALMMFVLAIMPGLPMAPFVLLGGVMAFVGYTLPRRQAARDRKEDARKADERAQTAAKESVKESLKTAEIELALGGHLSVHLLGSRTELGHRVAKIRKKFAKQYGFVIPEIKLTDNLSIDPKGYQIRIHDTRVAHGELRLGEVLVLVDKDGKPDVPGEEVIEPAFGMKALWVTEAFTDEVKRQGCKPVDNLSVLLTHLSEVIRANLAQLLSYKDMRGLLDRLDPEYKRLIEDLCPSQISYSGLLAILKILLAERVSIRNLHLILEAIAEIAPHVRRSEQVAEHVRTRLAQQICGDLSDNGVLNVVRLGNRWDLAFHQSLKRDPKGDVVEFDADPRLIEQFATEASAAIRKFTENGTSVVLAVTPEARPYVRMILERVFPTLPVLSHVEVARSAEIRALGAIS
ncbi:MULTISPECIES: flagellar biosynthesis protein FlhA [Bradyrhizobium]|uniref:Flagellar biosynthesis protein FlhA n=1 Tax=Bradyrhizobium diazoefficiens (strain JCM 10833 / BCRC 13528 / IAM 13628 / NBRC 14792 / USDA 110) TaxID=224911 RepID=Q89F50_BRADU|nr:MULTISPECIES: flagellar biosynthesis protein FlhA [Bradyrhizobium]AND91855.1 flagellar biosynthesis protein FlhA [Bradyrhizobium diazoefficiens USDA 110]MDA9389821.1 flagellar biosynthesis protein FlhA [Bradyrhizobium sp. CCBAU 45394]MDA9540085.1 flagellar biosynthesis protein FlhA [Bradyrhizobium sp. CCBAU 21362]PDT61740.1 flagellar biosynthesis protein FlhA [Bradyrhizobium diazoefficiens]QBP25592.1 flagellar biosynthesis protein FlhA [Bradyrhizobium diazoefficiens]